MTSSSSTSSAAFLNASASLNDRCLDLLTLQATQGLIASEQAELNQLLDEAGQGDVLSFELAAASLDLARISPNELSPLPETVASNLTRAGRRWAADRSRLTDALSPIRFNQRETPRSSLASWFPWALAASCAIVAATAFLRTAPSSTPSPSVVVATAPDLIKADWGAWDNPEIPNVRGYVHWSDQLQRGVMHFSGLPANDPRASQYQLWIIDERGLSQRINGAIFNSTPNGELDVEIAPSIAVRNAAAFAVTIEQPGGTWVSDMSRRVVIAKKG
ncbi:MAG: anti-sigma factor [Planctomycetota bacterium]|nr:anti-sigma factor [Planctomycetota bacterium]